MFKLAEPVLRGQELPDSLTDGHGTPGGINPDQPYPADNKGINAQGQIAGGRIAATGYHPVIAGLLDGSLQIFTTNGIDNPAPLFRQEHFLTRPEKSIPGQHRTSAQIPEKSRFVFAGEGRHRKTQPGQNGY